ncbi:hypothetical protein AVEN_244202-1 [Araneus ventricosus]|uniref:Uncharacterized protein n=1 Tax=Araneus ventricosus TaxID=182803 RepID=A0A4Y2CMF8_ARAVE|nr:hypothetical protein AVEN_244202-1 [Araneus ventricosus]
MIAIADLSYIILHISGILEAIEKIWNMASNEKHSHYDVWNKIDEMDSQVIESSQPIPPLQPPPPRPIPFYSNRSASPSSNPPSVSEMMGSEAVKFKDQLPEELKPEYERRLFEC